MNEKIDIYKTNLEGRKNSINDWKIPDAVKKDMLQFLHDMELGKVNKGKRLNARTQIKYINTLKVPLEYLNKPLTKIVLKDLEGFEKEIASGKIQSNKKKPYSHSVKVDMRIAIRILLRWKLGLDKANKLTDWFDCRDVETTPDFISEGDIEKLFKHCKSLQEKYLIAVLFDAGARIEEFLNVRFEDVKAPKGKENFYKITIKNEYSKTMGRNISLYWKYSSEAVRDYIEQRIREGIKTDEAVYNSTYDACRSFLRRLGIKVLNKSVHPHLFRHSSATFYANKLNRQELCIRYGWKFSSDMPDVYISRAGMENKELDEKFTQTELGELKYKFERQEQDSKMKAEEMDRIKKEKEASDKRMELVIQEITLIRNELAKRLQFDPLLNKLVKNPKVKSQIKEKIDNNPELLEAKKRGIGDTNVPRIKQ